MTNIVLPGGWGIAVCWTRSSSDSRELKTETRKTRIMKVGQAYQVITAFKLISKEEKTITRERGFLTRLIK